MSKKITRPLSVLLSVLMVVSLFTIVPFTASAAAEPVVQYVLVDTLENGGEYLIVNSSQAGNRNRYAFNSTINKTEVTVINGSPVYIEGEGVAANCVWTAEKMDTAGQFKLNNIK